jgi:hypothetical protein
MLLKVVRRRKPVVQKKQAGLHICLAVNSITMTKMHSSFNGQRLKYSLPLEGECGRVTGQPLFDLNNTDGETRCAVYYPVQRTL